MWNFTINLSEHKLRSAKQSKAQWKLRFYGKIPSEALPYPCPERPKSTKKHPAGCLRLTGSFLSSQPVSRQVLSASECLTTVFGMGTGGSIQASPPDIQLKDCSFKTIQKNYVYKHSRSLVLCELHLSRNVKFTS